MTLLAENKAFKAENKKTAGRHAGLVKRMKRMMTKYRGHHSLGKCMEKLERAPPDMFRFVFDSRIPADNNPAERLLRELMVHRKARGGIRSVYTMDWMVRRHVRRDVERPVPRSCGTACKMPLIARLLLRLDPPP